jgi:F0F1-type ATP synthase membrane subunit b/b'
MVIKMFVVIYFFDPIKKIKEKRKKYIEKNPKIQEDTHEESSKDCPSWR